VEYIRVRWRHNNPEDPIWLISELDDERWEIRKVEIFPNGSKGYADREIEFGGTWLGQVPVPPLSEISEDPEFLPEEISREEFEAIWCERGSPATPGQFR